MPSPRARLMVLVFSAHSNASPQVRREVERAIHKQLPVLPFRLEDIAPFEEPGVLPQLAALAGWLPRAARGAL